MTTNTAQWNAQWKYFQIVRSDTMKNQTDEPVEDRVTVKKLIRKQKPRGRKLKQELLQMWDDGLLNVFPDGELLDEMDEFEDEWSFL